jgi:hypothetical protein
VARRAKPTASLPFEKLGSSFNCRIRIFILLVSCGLLRPWIVHHLLVSGLAASMIRSL